MLAAEEVDHHDDGRREDRERREPEKAHEEELEREEHGPMLPPARSEPAGQSEASQITSVPIAKTASAPPTAAVARAT